MKKIVFLLSVILVSTSVNAKFCNKWEKNKIYCSSSLSAAAYASETDAYETFEFINFIQPSQGAQTWIGIQQLGNKSVWSKIAADTIIPLYNCAYKKDTKNVILGGKQELASESDIYVGKKPLVNLYMSFKCFCRANKFLLNNCGVRITEEATDDLDPFLGIAICNEGEISLK